MPSLVKLPELVDATMKIGTDKEGDADLRILLAAGSSLGGARPKASVIDKVGHPLTEMLHPISAWSLERISVNSAADILPFLRALRARQSRLLT